MAGPNHHRVAPVVLPEWAKTTKNDCLRVVAEDAYQAKRIAIEDYGAENFASCRQLLRAGEKALAALADTSRSVSARTAQGERSARYFWEAKACARRERYE